MHNRDDFMFFRLDAEKKRQALLAKLRLQERLLRREENLSAIGRILAISREHDEAYVMLLFVENTTLCVMSVSCLLISLL